MADELPEEMDPDEWAKQGKAFWDEFLLWAARPENKKRRFKEPEPDLDDDLPERLDTIEDQSDECDENSPATTRLRVSLTLNKIMSIFNSTTTIACVFATEQDSQHSATQGSTGCKIWSTTTHTCDRAVFSRA